MAARAHVIPPITPTIPLYGGKKACTYGEDEDIIHRRVVVFVVEVAVLETESAAHVAAVTPAIALAVPKGRGFMVGVITVAFGAAEVIVGIGVVVTNPD